MTPKGPPPPKKKPTTGDSLTQENANTQREENLSDKFTINITARQKCDSGTKNNKNNSKEKKNTHQQTNKKKY